MNNNYCNLFFQIKEETEVIPHLRLVTRHQLVNEVILHGYGHTLTKLLQVKRISL